MKKKFAFLTLHLLCALCIDAQTVYENENAEVYNYLYHMSQKGLVEFDDNIRPLSRIYLAACLDSLRMKSDVLTPVEKKELAFYRQEFSDLDIYNTSDRTDVHFLKKDDAGRWRTFLVKSKKAVLMADPVFTGGVITGSGKNVQQYSSGIKFWGYAGNHWAYQFYYNDYNEKGPGIDSLRQRTPETGILRVGQSNGNYLNFSEVRANVSYTWNNGSLSFGQDHLLWGYGENGRIVLSDKSPPSPYIRLDYQPFHWLRFNYTNRWLNSGIVDSTRTYYNANTVSGGQREIFISKYMATHSAQFRLKKGMNLSLGESIVYSDRIDIGYLIPLMFFKVYDNMVNNGNIHAGSNGQLFLQFSSRNNIPRTHFYGTLFIDEIRLSTVFDKEKNRNQLGYTFGINKTDLFIPYFTAGVEYTRVRPFVYSNLITAQTYTNYGYSLGDWMGNNFDRLLFTIKYTPLPKLKMQAHYQYIRKGSPGTIEQQYLQQPQPPFLFGLQYTQKEFYTLVSYEWINSLTFHVGYCYQYEDNKVSGNHIKTNTFSVGFKYGLY